MTPQQKELVRSSFQMLLPRGQHVAALFYKRLFEMDPTLQPLFQGSMTAQRRKFMDTLDVALRHLDRLDQIVPVLWQLGKRHGGYGVRDEHYDTVRTALLSAIAEELGEAFTPDVEKAWMDIYDLMSITMKEAAAEGIVPRPT